MEDMRPLAPDWYAQMIGSSRCRSMDAMIEQRCPAWLASLASRFGPVRALLLFVLAEPAATLAVVKKAPGTQTLLFLEAWVARRRRVVLLEFLPRPLPRTSLRRRLYRALFALVERPSVRRAMLAAQVLTDGERARYAHRYRLPADRFQRVPWALLRSDSELPPFAPGARGVVSSGRASCDWETLFSAARGTDWPLTVICAGHDLERIELLNEDNRARVLVELSRSEHDEHLRSAAVYAMPLVEDGPSAGHVRLMAAVGAGAPVVASRVRGLEGYMEEGETAVLVAPGDASALRAAVERLISSPDERRRLRESAFARARSRTYDDYFAAIADLLAGPQPPRSISSGR